MGSSVPRHTVSHHPESDASTDARSTSLHRVNGGLPDGGSLSRRRDGEPPSVCRPRRLVTGGESPARHRPTTRDAGRGAHDHGSGEARGIPMNSKSTCKGGGVVVAVDGSEQGYVAVRYAAREAHRLGVSLHAIHVLPSTAFAGSAMMMMVPDESFRSYGAEILERARTTALEAVPDLQVTTQLRMGGRIQQLIAVAAQARLMVLGSRSPGSLDRIWTGGTVTGVASRAACPVVVVPAEGEPRCTARAAPGGVAQVASARGRAVRRVVPSGRRARRRAGRAARLATRGRLRRHHRRPRGGGGVVPSADRADRTGAGGLPGCVPDVPVRL